MIIIRTKKQNYLKLISSTLCLLFIFSLLPYKPLATKVKAETVASPTQYSYFPTASEVDGRFLELTGRELQGLSGAKVSFNIAVPKTESKLEIGIFDGDSQGEWDSYNTYYAKEGPLTVLYTVYADPQGDGKNLTKVGHWDNSQMLDNNWYNILIDNDPRAIADSGDYFYRLEVTTPNQEIYTRSAFKVRAKGTIELNSSSTFAFTARLSNDRKIIYPNYDVNKLPAQNDLKTTTYDGTWKFFFTLPTEATEVSLWDGDLDYFGGSKPLGYDENYESIIESIKDTDDSDTPNDSVPSWAEGTAAVKEGVAEGEVDEYGIKSSGAPRDDSPDLRLVRNPSIYYTLYAPDGQSFKNDNPSGNQEWEQFKVSTDSFDRNKMDYHADKLPQGIYKVEITGADMNNQNAWVCGYRILGVNKDGDPVPMLKPYVIGDTIWHDANGNGIQDNSEQGLINVIVELRDLKGNLLESTTTDSNGHYNFNVYPADYKVAIAASNYKTGGALEGFNKITKDSSSAISIVDISNLDVDFGLAKEGTVKTNYLEEGDNTPLLPSKSTNGLVDTNYSTTKESIPGYEYVKVVGNEAGTYVSGTTEVTYYYRKLTSLGDKVWLDKNNDGIQDATEPGIAGIIVKLLKNDDTPVLDGDGKEITTVTDANGNYSFRDISNGDYKVQFISNKDFYKFGEKNKGTTDNDSNVDKVTGITDLFTLNAGDVNNSIDAAFTVKTELAVEKTAYLGKYDVNKIGTKSVSGKNDEDITYIFTVKNTGDTYIKDLVVNDITLKVDKSKFTKISGAEPLAPGASIVYYYETKINGDLTNKVEVSGTPSDKDGNIVPNIDNLNSSDTAEAKALGSMGDRVWNDLNKDGKQDDNEPGLKAVTVKLTDSKGNTVTTTTDDKGNYIFDRLTPDKYTVSIDQTTLPKNMEETFEKDNSKDNKVDVDLTAGQVIDDVDFGYKVKEGTLVVKYLEEGSNKELASTETTIQPIETDFKTMPKDIPGYKLVKPADNETGKYVEGTTTVTYYYKKLINIGDFIWNDLNGDGKQDLGETGIPGVVIDLKNEAGEVVATTTTDATGHYNFNTTVGKYSVSVNILKSLENNSLIRFNPKTTNTVEGLKDLSADFKDFDFGYYIPGTLGNSVWFDANGNKTKDDGEEGIPNVTLNLLDKDGKILKTLKTDATGAYKFEDLAPGTYTVSIAQNTLPTFIDKTYELDNTLDGNVQVIVKSGDVKNDVDFGYKKQIGTLTVKYVDENGKELLSPKTSTENVGTGYTTSKENIRDYDFVKVDGNESGTYINGNITVTYIYKKKQIADKIDVVGTVTDEKTGAVIPGCTVFLKDVSGKSIRQTTTDTNGNYSFDNVPVGEYVITVNNPKYSTKNVEFTAQSMNLIETKIRQDVKLVNYQIQLVANPSIIVGDGKSKTSLTSTVLDKNGVPVEGVIVTFSADGVPDSNFSSTTAITDKNGKATVQFTSLDISGIEPKVITVKAKVDDDVRDLHATEQVLVTFEPGSIKGVVTDNAGNPIEGAEVIVSRDFNSDGIIDFYAKVVTGKDGRYTIAVPKGNTEYNLSITKPVQTGNITLVKTFEQTAKVGNITGEGNESFDSNKTATGLILAKTSNGEVKTLNDYSKYDIDIYSMDGLGKVLLGNKVDGITANINNSEGDSKGIFKVEGLEKGKTYAIAITYTFPNTNQKIIVGTLPVVVNDDGQINICSSLIDPYGIVVDSVTGNVVSDAHTVLYYANTPENIAKGNIPDTQVYLPLIPGFSPNDNANPQNTDKNGAYAFMVYPDSDYYIVISKPGYETYTTGTIHVGKEIVHNDDIKLVPINKVMEPVLTETELKKETPKAEEVKAETVKIEETLPKTGSAVPYAPYALGLLSIALGLYIFKRK